MREVSDGNRWAFSLFADSFVLVIFTNSKILSKSFSFFNFNNWDFISASKSFNKLNIVCFIAVLGKDHIFSFKLLILVFNSLADLMKSLSEKRVRVAGLDDSFESSIVICHLGFSHRFRWLTNIIILIFNIN